ncbi:sugar ABC transporter substrate-binding protein [Microbacterium wangchenii]|uniref:Sugar ABC transporter substrate-binding protein n=2 Tax=Microbacteriaceae TaxID=85023 RepID=A0ABX5SU54_9MICO|nr:sugar ABC transporter substrate-binding protein [Microbacterium wangchenii]TXK16687.1 substrate-binding domain-containing protein [Microbacterium wangchenii]
MLVIIGPERCPTAQRSSLRDEANQEAMTMKFPHIRRAGAAVAATVAATLLLAGCGGTADAGNGTEGGEPEGLKIALSNGFVNGWRLTLIDKFETEADKLKAEGVVSDYSVVNAPGENSATEQASQIRSLMLQNPDVLMVIPASSSALKPVIEEACTAGINVIILDADMETSCGTVVRNEYGQWGADSLEPALEAIGGKGDIVINRGVVGSQPEEAFHARQLEILADYPDVKVAAEINGFCDSATAQKEIVGILGSLPEIAAVPGCIGGMGIVQAFESAGREAPVVVFDTDGKSLKFWQDSGIDNGSFAALTDPGQVVAAIYVALAKERGDDVPAEVVLPLVKIAQEDLDYWVSELGTDEYAAIAWDDESIEAALEALENGEDVQAPALQK